MQARSTSRPALEHVERLLPVARPRASRSPSGVQDPGRRCGASCGSRRSRALSCCPPGRREAGRRQPPARPGDPLPVVVDAERRLGRAEEQEAARAQRRCRTRRRTSRLVAQVEVDEHVAQEHHVERAAERRRRRAGCAARNVTVRRAAAARPPSRRRRASKCVTSIGAGRPRLTSSWLYRPARARVEHLLGQVGGEDLERRGRRQARPPASSRSSTAPARSSTRPTRSAAAPRRRAAASSGGHDVPSAARRTGAASRNQDVSLVVSASTTALEVAPRCGGCAGARHVGVDVGERRASRASGSSRLSTRYSLPGSSWIALRRRTRSATKAKVSGVRRHRRASLRRCRPRRRARARSSVPTSSSGRTRVGEPGGRDRAGHAPHDAASASSWTRTRAAGGDDVLAAGAAVGAHAGEHDGEQVAAVRARPRSGTARRPTGRQKFTGGPSVERGRAAAPRRRGRSRWWSPGAM